MERAVVPAAATPCPRPARRSSTRCPRSDRPLAPARSGAVRRLRRRGRPGVLRTEGGLQALSGPLPFRRSRGALPAPLALDRPAEPCEAFPWRKSARPHAATDEEDGWASVTDERT